MNDSVKEVDQRNASSLISKFTLGVIHHLEQKTGVTDVKYEKMEGTLRHEIFIWEQRNSCTLPEDMRAFYLISNGFKLTWSIKTENVVIPLGKMFLNKIQDMKRIGGTGVRSPGPGLGDLEDDFDSVDDGERIGSHEPSFSIHKSQAFELDPCDGLGKVCLVYEKNNLDDPHIWFLDRSLRWHFMADNFSDYYRLTLVNLGLPQWQYSFTDVGLSLQAKQWFHMFAPNRLELNQQLHLPQGSYTSPSDYNQLDCERLFQKQKADRKKAATGTRSDVNPSSTIESHLSSLTKKRTLAPSLGRYGGGSQAAPKSLP